MGDLFWDLGKIQNGGELIAAKVIGTTIGFQHANQLPVPIKAEVIRNDPLEVSTNGKIQEQREIELVIPSQPPLYSGVSGFSGGIGISAVSGSIRSISTGDKIEYPAGSTQYYWVTQDTKTSNDGWTHVVIAQSKRTWMGGQRA